MPGCRMYVPPLSESPAMSARSQLSTNLATRLLDCESRDHSGPPPQSTRHSDASHSARGAGDGPLGGGGGQVAVLTFQQTRGVGSMLGCCWFSVVDDGPMSARHWASASCLLCFYSLWITANAWHSPYVALMSGQGLQRWSRIKAALGLCLVFASLVLTTDPENSTSWAYCWCIAGSTLQTPGKPWTKMELMSSAYWGLYSMQINVSRLFEIKPLHITS